MKLGLALSGGGIRGIAHAGVLQALEENNIKIDIIGGTSSGGIVASLYAMGYTPHKIFNIFKKNANNIVGINSKPLISGLTSFIGRKKATFIGFKTGESLEESFLNLGKVNGIEKISDIKMPLVIPAVDIADSREYIFTNYIPKENKDNVKYITDIPIGRAVRASSSFPAIFCPCDFETHKFLDGGMLDNIPVTEVKKQGASKVIAVTFEPDEINDSSNVMDIAMRSIDIMGNRISENSLKQSDYILTIKTDKTGLLDTKNIESCYKYGYEATLQNINNIKDIFK
ncbi:MAG: patatin-like phospholipase family protein [Clostridia bacterium]|nr:patatin-like phospholipase family protein [Clostridia bacterium]